MEGNFITDPSEGQDSGGGLAVSENACLGCGLGGCMGCNGNGCYGCALGCTGCPSCGSCGYGCGCQGCPGFQACEGCQACPGYQPIAACDGSQGCPGYQACGGCQACQGYPCQGCDASQAYGCLGCGCDLQACPGCQGFYQPVQGCEAFQACGAYGCGGCDLAAFGCQDGAALAGCACTGAVDMTNKILGAVKNWNPERGYGFLRTEGYDKDIFFPRRELPPDFQNEPNINGFSFAFEMTSAPDGRPQAKGLQCMGGLAQPTPPPSAGMERIGERVQGQVKSFSSKGGYGFMSMPGSGDIFFAKRDIPMAMQETNLIGTRFEFEIGRSNDGRTQAKNLVCLDPSGYAPGVAPPTPRLPGESFPDGSRMAGQIKMIGQEGGIITCPTASEELPFTPNDLPAVLQRKVMAGDFMQIQSASVLFSMVNAQGRSFAKEVVVLPPPEEILIGEVVQFNAGAGYGFIKPGPHGIFQQDVYFNTKDMVSLTEQQRLSLAGQSCRFHLRLTPDNRPQARKVELLSAVQPTSRFSYEPPPSALPQGAATGFSEKRPGGVLEEPASKRQA